MAMFLGRLSFLLCAYWASAAQTPAQIMRDVIHLSSEVNSNETTIWKLYDLYHPAIKRGIFVPPNWENLPRKSSSLVVDAEVGLWAASNVCLFDEKENAGPANSNKAEAGPGPSVLYFNCDSMEVLGNKAWATQKGKSFVSKAIQGATLWGERFGCMNVHGRKLRDAAQWHDEVVGYSYSLWQRHVVHGTDGFWGHTFPAMHPERYPWWQEMHTMLLNQDNSALDYVKEVRALMGSYLNVTTFLLERNPKKPYHCFRRLVGTVREPQMDPSSMEFFRRHALQQLGIGDNDHTCDANGHRLLKVFFIERRPESSQIGRNIVNMQEVREWFMGQPWLDQEFYARARANADLAGLSFHEQVAFMNEADLLVGVHGAGMMNTVWMRPFTAALEIQPSLMMLRALAESAQSKGMHYQFHVAEDCAFQNTTCPDFCKDDYVGDGLRRECDPHLSIPRLRIAVEAAIIYLKFSFKGDPC